MTLISARDSAHDFIVKFSPSVCVAVVYSKLASDHTCSKTTGFSPFKLPTRSPLQKAWDHSLPNVS